MPIGTSDGQHFDSEDMMYAQGERPRVYIPTNENNAPAGSSGAPRGIPEDVETKENAQFVPGFNAGSWTDTLKSTWDNISKLKDVRMSDIVKGIANSVVSAATLPGDVLSGKVQPGSQQEVERAFDLAGMMVMGPAPVAKSMADGTLGSFAGVRSNMSPALKSKLYQAQDMEMMAAHPDEVWTQTGFFRGADYRWRYEIPDTPSKLVDDAFDINYSQNKMDWTSTGGHDTISIKAKRKFLPSSEEIAKMTDDEFANWYKEANKTLKLDQVLHHPQLFEAYPHLKDVAVEPMTPGGLVGGYLGIYNPGTNTIYLNKGTPEQVRSTLLHEVQHAIQTHEKFARGGNPSEFIPQEVKMAEKEFKNIAKQAMDELKEKGVDVESYMWAVKRELEGTLSYGTQRKTVQRDLKLIEEAKEKGFYNSLRNIARSQFLLDEAQEQATHKYRSLAGEVEARNVQRRLEMSDLDKKINSPKRTQEMPDEHQSVVYEGQAAMGSADNTVQLRRAANDNDPNAVKPLPPAVNEFESMEREMSGILSKEYERSVTEPHEIFIKKYDELNKFREEVLMKKGGWTEFNVARYNKMGRELNGEDAWTDVPFK